MASIKQLQDLDRLAADALQHWRAYLVHAEVARLAGDEQPFLRGTAGFRAASRVREVAANLLGTATGWPSVHGFGTLSPKVAVPAPEPVHYGRGEVPPDADGNGCLAEAVPANQLAVEAAEADRKRVAEQMAALVAAHDERRCNATDCGLPSVAIGLCHRHYQQNYRANAHKGRRAACINGRRYHSYDQHGKCRFCKAGRAYSA